MTCRQAHRHFLAHSCGDPTPDGFGAHLATCEACRTALREYGDSVAAVRATGRPSASEHFASRVMDSVRAEARPRRPRNVVHGVGIAVAAAAAIVLVSLGGMQWVRQHTPPPGAATTASNPPAAQPAAQSQAPREGSQPGEPPAPAPQRNAPQPSAEPSREAALERPSAGPATGGLARPAGGARPEAPGTGELRAAGAHAAKLTSGADEESRGGRLAAALRAEAAPAAEVQPPLRSAGASGPAGPGPAGGGGPRGAAGPADSGAVASPGPGALGGGGFGGGYGGAGGGVLGSTPTREEVKTGGGGSGTAPRTAPAQDGGVAQSHAASARLHDFSFRDTAVRQALRSAARAGGVGLSISSRVPTDARVSVTMHQVTAGAAIEQICKEAGLEVRNSGGDRYSIDAPRLP